MGQLEQDGADSSAQELPFLGSHGALYNRYDRGGLWKDIDEWYTFTQGAHGLDELQSKVISELSTPEDVNGENFVEHVRGYFHAPVDGVYRFAALSDDEMIMKMSSVKNNANQANMQMVLQME